MTFDEAASKAINAANRVLFDAGFTDKTVVQIGFAPTSATRDESDRTQSISVDQVFETWLCGCYDCVGVPTGRPCICNGPNCPSPVES